MDEQEIKKLVEEWTNVTLPEKSDPYYQWRMRGDEISFSVSGLTWDFAVNLHSRKLFEGVSLSKYSGIQLHRVLQSDTVCMHYRLCSAMKGSDYDAYMVGRATFVEGRKSLDVANEYIEMARACCR